jgi:tRNA dimethylallyltransferase
LKSKTIIVIAGPTAVGKTSLAIELAKHFNTEIISADSRQCFTELNIGVAKPSVQQLSEIKHYFVNSHSIHDDVNAATFEEYALQSAREIFLRHDVALMVGGTGLYIQAFCNGLDEIPRIPSDIREAIKENYEGLGLAWLQEQVRTSDPEYFKTGEIENPQRLMRALEVKTGTGKSIRQFQQNKKASRDFSIIKVGLQLPREQLHSNIHYRVDEMMKHGLLLEVKSLMAFQSLPALRTVGYTELFAFLENRISLDEAVDLIKKNTRHYAKRQLTWFRKDDSVTWVTPYEKQKIIDLYQV